MPDDPDPLRDIVLIVRAGALFPAYRTFSLLEQLKGQVHRPAVLFYPGQARRRRRPPLHGRPRRRTQLPTEDLLRNERWHAHDHSDLFASNIDRHIEEVIKVDQTDEQIVRDEIDEYVATDAIAATTRHPRALRRDAEQAARGHRRLGLRLLRLRQVELRQDTSGSRSRTARSLGEQAGELFAQAHRRRQASQVLLKSIAEHIPTHAVIFDVSTDRGIRSGNQTITEIMYRLFLHSLGYASDLDLAELEITLEAEGRLDEFKATVSARSSARTGTTRRAWSPSPCSEASARDARTRARDYSDNGLAGATPAQATRRHHARASSPSGARS